VNFPAFTRRAADRIDYGLGFPTNYYEDVSV